jgi:hypothetical protein
MQELDRVDFFVTVHFVIVHVVTIQQNACCWLNPFCCLILIRNPERRNGHR